MDPSITACIMFIKNQLALDEPWTTNEENLLTVEDISGVLLVLYRFKLDDARKVWNGWM